MLILDIQGVHIEPMLVDPSWYEIRQYTDSVTTQIEFDIEKLCTEYCSHQHFVYVLICNMWHSVYQEIVMCQQNI